MKGADLMSLTKRSFVASFLFPFLSLTFLVVFSFNRPQAQSDKVKVEGYVYDADGKPVKKVTVRVYYSVQKSESNTTDGTGYYSVSFPKNSQAISVSYIPESPNIYFPALEELSGSTNHNISRTPQGRSGVYTLAGAMQLNRDARSALSAGVTDEKTKKYYRKLLSDARIEEGSVTNEATGAFLQTLFNETRHQYNLDTEQLKTESGRAVTSQGSVTLSIGPRESNSCMTVDTLQQMLDRICYETSPAIAGLSRTDAINLRRRLDCSGPRLPPNPGDRPNPRPTPRIRP